MIYLTTLIKVWANYPSPFVKLCQPAVCVRIKKRQ